MSDGCDEHEYYPITTITSPSRTESPLRTLTSVTVPSTSASILFSIFMASRRTTVCPAFTLSPTLTKTSRIVPGSGVVTFEPFEAAAGDDVWTVPLGAALTRGAVRVVMVTCFCFNSLSTVTLYGVPLTSRDIS